MKRVACIIAVLLSGCLADRPTVTGTWEGSLWTIELTEAGGIRGVATHRLRGPVFVTGARNRGAVYLEGENWSFYLHQSSRDLMDGWAHQHLPDQASVFYTIDFVRR